MSTRIHQTALISPECELGDNTVIGPYAVLDGRVRLGAGCVVQAHAVLTGEVVIGPGCLVGYGAIIGAEPQDVSYSPENRTSVVIGSDNRIREYATIHRGSKPGGVTRVGDGCYLMAGAHLGHDCTIGNRVTIANNCLLGGHVRVDDGAFLGGGSVFHQFVRIGTLCITQGISGLGMNLPPYLIATGVNQIAGLNVIGLRRAGFSPDVRTEIKRAFRHVYRSDLPLKSALATAETQTWGAEATAFFDFIREAGKRGIAGLGKAAGGDED